MVTKVSTIGSQTRDEAETQPRPFLKWAGGKTQLLDELARHVPKDVGRYIEPFVGGGALYFHLRPRAAVLADLNEDLINAYRVVRDDVDALIDKLAGYRNEEEFYYTIREQDPARLEPVRRAAWLIYLNKTCFNGLYRVNKHGKFNVPFGRRTRPTICDEPGLRAAHDALKGAELVHGDYKQVLQRHARAGDFVYLDPPYYPAGGFADFKRFTKEFFYEEDHVELRDEFCRLVDLGCLVILTNSNTEFVRQLYQGFEYKVLDTRRSISSNASTRTGQDLIVAVTKPRKRTLKSIGGRSEKLLEHFPGTRFMGSKYRVLPFIWDAVKALPFRSMLDAFSGSACVSYMLKQRGVKVISNDFLHFAYHISKATVENPKVLLDDSDVQMLMSPNGDARDFVAVTFKGLYFTDEENRFLDSLRANIELLNDPHKKSLALAAISRACLKRRPRGVFTYVGDRYDDGRNDLKIDLKQHFLANVQAFNGAVFDNGHDNHALNCDVFDLDVDADLVYLDPPYYTPHSDNEYTRRYHFIEGLVRQWEGLQIQFSTKTRKFRRYDTPFTDKNRVHDAFDRLFDKFRDSILVVSYSSNAIPEKTDMVAMLKKWKRQVTVYQADHLYSFGTHGHLTKNPTSRVKEYIFVAE